MPPSCIVRTYVRTCVRTRVSTFTGRLRNNIELNPHSILTLQDVPSPPLEPGNEPSRRNGRLLNAVRSRQFSAVTYLTLCLLTVAAALFDLYQLDPFPLKAITYGFGFFYSRLPSVDFAMHYLDLMQSQQIRQNVYNQCNLTKDSVYKRNYSKQYHL